MHEPSFVDGPICKGDWKLGTACGKCHKCNITKPQVQHVPSGADRFPTGVYTGESYYTRLEIGDIVSVPAMSLDGVITACYTVDCERRNQLITERQFDVRGDGVFLTNVKREEIRFLRRPIPVEDKHPAPPRPPASRYGRPDPSPLGWKGGPGIDWPGLICTIVLFVIFVALILAS